MSDCLPFSGRLKTQVRAPFAVVTLPRTGCSAVCTLTGAQHRIHSPMVRLAVEVVRESAGRVPH